MSTVTYYQVKYPDISETITKKELDSTYTPLPSRDEIYAVTWDEAHKFLQSRAMKRIVKANKELNSAIEHMAKVMNMRNPEVFIPTIIALVPAPIE